MPQLVNSDICATEANQLATLPPRYSRILNPPLKNGGKHCCELSTTNGKVGSGSYELGPSNVP